MLMLISDANILIDMEAGGLLQSLFRLPYRFAMPDLLYVEEIEEGTPGLDKQGLQLLEVRAEFVDYALSLRDEHGNGPSHNDYLALALALALAVQEGCPLLTGDGSLRVVAQAVDVDLKGTIWLLREMLVHGLHSREQMLEVLALMKARGRRLPWALAESELLKELEQ